MQNRTCFLLGTAWSSSGFCSWSNFISNFGGFPSDFSTKYADDMCISVCVKNYGLGIGRLKECLTTIAERARSLGIDFDAQKTKIVVVTPKHCRKVLRYSLTFKGRRLEYVNPYKYLGVWIDQRFSFRYLVRQKCSEASRRVNQINRLQIGSALRRSMYLGYVQAYLFYCLRPIWRFLADCWRKRLNSVVENGCRMVSTLTKWAVNSAEFCHILSPAEFCSPSPRKLKSPSYFTRCRSEEVPLLRCLHGSGWCNYRKFRMNLIQNSNCRFCHHPSETIDHLVFLCPRLDCNERSSILEACGNRVGFENWDRNWSRRKYGTLAKLLKSFCSLWDLYF